MAAVSADLLDRLEIYIPVEAEVKTIPLWSLPNSVLRRMSLPPSECEGSRTPAESPQGIWICPAVLRRKGQKQAPQTEAGATENLSSVVATAGQAGTGPVRMSFVSSNRAAYSVLKDCMPGRKVSAEAPLLAPGSALRSHHHAVIVYRGCIFFSIRKPKRNAAEPQPTAPSPVPSTSGVSSDSRRKELLNRLKKKATMSAVAHSDDRKDVTHRGGDVSSSRAVRQPAAAEPVCLQEEAASGDGEMQHLSSESTNQSHAMDSSAGTGSCVSDSSVGVVEQSSSQSWSSRGYQGPGGSTSLYPEFDYKELQHQEELNLIKAKLKAANDNLQRKVRVSAGDNC